MNKIKATTLAAILLGALTLTSNKTQAGETVYSGKTFKEVTIVENASRFRNQEIQLDAFFIQTFAGRTNGQTINTGPGGGFGINGIFARYFGVGIENYWYSNDNQTNYTLGAFGILRYPIDAANLAPYLTIGGGSGWTANNANYGFGSLGIGLEYRITDNIGTFVDGKWYFGAPDSAGTLRTGVRLAF